MLMKIIKDNLKIIAIILIGVIAFPIIILTPSNIGILPPDIAWQIVGYGGAIIGGLLTLLGVWLTIEHQNNQRREDLSIQYKPFLIVDRELDTCEGYLYREFSFCTFCTSKNGTIPQYMELSDLYNDNVKIMLLVKNIGRGNVCDWKFLEYKIKDPDIFDNFLQPYSTNMSLSDLVPQQGMALAFKLPAYLRVKNEYLNERGINTSIYFSSKFSDEFNYHKYKFEISIPIEIKIHKTSFESDDSKTSIIQPTYCYSGVMPNLSIIE